MRAICLLSFNISSEAQAFLNNRAITRAIILYITLFCSSMCDYVH